MEEKNNKDENIKKEKNSKLKIVFIGIMLILIYFDACGLFLLLKVKSNDFISAKYKQEIKVEKNNTSENLSNSIESTSDEVLTQESSNQSKNESSIEINEDESKTKEPSSSSNIKEKSSSCSITSIKSSSISSDSSNVNSNFTPKSSSSSIKSSSVPSRKITNIVEEKELKETTEKYGVKINTYNIISYNIYNDGTKEIKTTRTQTEYDRSNFSATTNDLKAEAQSARNINAGMINKVLQNTNAYRMEANEKAINDVTDRKELILDEKLCLAASVRAVEMAYTNKMTHVRPNGSYFMTVLKDLGISFWEAGENVACGQNTADAASKTWKNSPGHYSNMINSNYGKIGIGVYKAGGGYFWTQIFTN